MTLEIFNFIEEVIDTLDDSRMGLEALSNDIEKFFEEILTNYNEGYLNINSRVKSSSSLREKILRNNYYKKYNSPEDLLENLSDLIGVRIECRFIQDEHNIYDILKKSFKNLHSDGLYFNSLKENIRLDLRGKQPQEQKNGFKIYRIDGVYELKDRRVNFELQIKALVNIFWSEIEHKVIYKNYNYMLVDKFFKEMMGSIKRNLTMIDNQLLIIYNQFNNSNSIEPGYRKYQLEMFLFKIIHDIFSKRVRSNLGFMVDFRKSCDVIMEYIFSSSSFNNVDNYNQILINTLNRINAVSTNDTRFDTEITFERDIIFEDEFSRLIGNNILEQINCDFQWNLFFRILFEIEFGNNAEDFEDFIKFFKNKFVSNKGFSRIYEKFNDDGKKIADSIMLKIAEGFTETSSIEFLYRDNVNQINEAIENVSEIICKNINSYEEWRILKKVYLDLVTLKIFSIFNLKISTVKANEIIEEVKQFEGKIDINKKVLKYITKIEKQDKIKAEDILNLFEVL